MELSAAEQEPEPAKDEPEDLRGQLRRILVCFAAISDGLLERVGDKDRAIVRFYLDSPRFHILDLTPKGDGATLSIDLRRDQMRAVAVGPVPQYIFSARILRGVVEGTLERLLIDLVTAESREKGEAELVFSTSSFFDFVQDEHIQPLLLSSEKALSGIRLPKESEARLRHDLARGYFSLAAQEPVTFSDEKRFAWWRIDPRTGETVAVTDLGLFQTTTEYHWVQERGSRNVRIVRLNYVDGRLVSHGARDFTAGTVRLSNYLRNIVGNGGQILRNNVPFRVGFY